MARETVKAKAERYLIEGRIVLEKVTRNGVSATVRGEGARYRTTWTAGPLAHGHARVRIRLGPPTAAT